ncbi:MAG: PDZ domain-containing protein, partial [Phaeodactylibacter sp.]|nr:PDZ domain-containing protein [Phaeodactylibacter sp.]
KKLGFENPYGSYVTSVVKNSAADKAGLQPFDYIYGLDDRETQSRERLGDMLAEYEPGDQVRILYMRKGKSQSASVTLGTRADGGDETIPDEERAFLGISPMYNPNVGDVDGVMVSIVDKSAAEDMGLEKEDIITTINGNRIIDWEDVTTALSNLRAGETIAVGVSRDGQNRTFKGKLKSKYETVSSRGPAVAPEPTPRVSSNAFLGVNLETISKNKAEILGADNPYGFYVTNVIPGTAAEKAGLQSFDYIYGVDEYRVGENQSLGGILTKYEPGDEIQVFLVRKGQKRTVRVTLGTREDIQKKPSTNKCEDAFFGITESESNPKELGVQVGVVEKTSATDLGLKDGDVIQSINGYKIFDWGDIGMAIDMLKPGETIQVEYKRDGTVRTGTAKVKSYAETKGCENCDCSDKKAATPFPFNWHTDEDEEAVRDISNMTATVTNLSSSQIESLEDELGINLLSENDLSINSIQLRSNLEKGMFELSFTLPKKGDTMVRLYNQTGRLVYNYELGAFSGRFSDHLDLDLAGQKTATYYLEVRQADQSTAKKIVVKKG